MSQSVLDDDLAKQSEGFLDFDTFFHLLANIVCRSSLIVKNQNKLRKLKDLPLLFGDNALGIRERFKDLDCTFILRQLVSQFLKYDANSINDLTIK